MTRRVALVTGAGGSIGAEVSSALASAGFAIAVNDIDAGAAQRTVESLAARGDCAAAFVADVGDSAAVEGMVERIERELGAIAVLVNNAGHPGRFSLIVDTSDEQWNRTMQVHLSGAFHLVRACAKRMARRRFGRIVNIASLAGTRGTVGSAAYGVAKAGLINLARSAAKELGPLGITVNAIAPGMVATAQNSLLHARGSRFIESALEGTPSRRMAEPGGIAALVAFLASDAAADVNGAAITVDGGASLTMTTDLYMREELVPRSACLREEDGDASAG